MKKLFTSITVALLGASAVYAQNASSFAFTYKGETVANGATIVITEYGIADGTEAGDGIFAMHAPIQVKNASSKAAKLSLFCAGKENYEYSNEEGSFFATVQFCPNGNCQPWTDEAMLSTTYDAAIAAGAVADESDWIHVSIMSDDPNAAWTYKASVELKAVNADNESDCATITVVFDTNEGVNGGVQRLHSFATDSKVEIFNLCGKMVANSTAGLTKGIYIVKQNGASRKVVIK